LTGPSAAAATSTTLRETAKSMADWIAATGGRLPSSPKLMLMARAPRFVASTIEPAMLPSVRSLFSTISLQSRPAPAMPIPLLVAAQASEATCVPWPSWSVVGGLGVCSWSTAAAILPESSGCAPSRPVSMTPTRAPAPSSTSQARWKRCFTAGHSMGVPGGTPDAVSGLVSAVSLGAARRVIRPSSWTERTEPSRRRARAKPANELPAGSRTVTRPISGTCGPARRAPVRARKACTAEAWAGASPARWSRTSTRPVGAAWAGAAASARPAAARSGMDRRAMRSS
jgi:hypothetical protein